jgi:signal transduction histidine kinase
VKEKTNRLKHLNEQLIDAEEMERKAVASDLHDGVVQNLAMSISTIKDIKESTIIPNKQVLSDIQGYLEQSVREIRSLIYKLAPPILDDFDIEIALGVLVEEIKIKYKGNIEYINNIKGPILFDKTTKTVLYRAVNELITNIIKHSESETANVIVSETKNMMQICVEDDGVGFCLEKIQHTQISSFGLSNLMERIKNINCDIKIFCEPGKGTKILLLAPK